MIKPKINDEVKRHLCDANENLKQNRMLTEAECIQLKNDIMSLSLEKKYVAKSENNMVIDKLLADYKNNAGISRTMLEDIAAAISGGKVPSSEERKKLNDSLDNLTKKYGQIHEILCTELYNFKDILKKFIAVRALSNEYEAEITLFQDAAKTLLNKIENNELDNDVMIFDEIAGPELFLKVAKSDIMTSGESLYIIKKLVALGYSPIAIYGLSKNQYYVKETPNEKKKVTASIFIREMKKLNEKECKKIIRIADKYSVVSKELLKISLDMPEINAERWLEYIKDEGYLKKYHIPPGNAFYCITMRLNKALSFKEASRFAEVRQHKAGDFCENDLDSLDSTCAKKCILNFAMDSELCIRIKKDKKIKTNNILFENGFIYRMCDSESMDAYRLFAGLFRTEKKECDDYIAALKKAVNEIKVLDFFVMASATSDAARKIMNEIIAEKLEGLQKIPIYIYSLNENEFTEYSSGDKVDKFMIWTELKKQA